MIETTLTINSTNAKLPNTITIAPRTRDTSTSLVLHGDGVFNFGQELLTNLVQLTENFCNGTAPASPIPGQKFYNSAEKQLYVYHGELNLDGTAVVGDWLPITITENTSTLDIVYESEKTSNHSDRTLAQYTSQLIPLTGNTTPVTLTLIDVDPVYDNQAVTKKYVDSVLNRPEPYIPIYGVATMTGPLILANTERSYNDNTLVNIKYVDELGTLTITDDIVNPSGYNVTTYKDESRKQDDGTDDISPWFTTVWFNETIPDGSNSKQITLPVTFSTAGNIDSSYNYSMAVTCNSVGSNVQLHVTVNTGSSITVLRQGTAGDLKISGNVYGFRDR